MTTTLADIERATARRVGPYFQSFLDRQVPSTASFETVLLPALRSNVEQDLVTNLWILRRGVDWQGTPVIVDPIDRQRLVSSYDAARGAVTVDRPYSVAPAAGEVVEFHHLDPEHELREIVRAGLKRCLFEDRFQLGQGYIYEADLTSVLPWLDDVNMVKAMQIAPFPTGWPGSAGGPCDVPFETFGQAGHVWVRVSGAGNTPFYGGLFLTVHRPHFSWVNQTDTVGGPTLDADTLDVDVEYAASAAHIEGWHLLPAKLQAAAAGNLQATREQAALEYTRMSYLHRLPRHDRYGFNRSFGYGFGYPVVINA